MGNDAPFWNALNANVKNLHAVISGHGAPPTASTSKLIIDDIYSSPDHGNEWCAREPTKDVIFCFDKHSG